MAATQSATVGMTADAPALWARYKAHDFFALRSELPAGRADETADVAFLRAATLGAFGQYAASARAAAELLSARSGGRALELETRNLLMLDRRAQFRYASALSAVAPLLGADSGGFEDRKREIANRARLLRVLTDVPPQSVSPGTGAPVELDRSGRVRVVINGRAARVLIDTGANFSVVSRRTAVALGLTVRRAGYALGSSLGGIVAADVAVAGLAFEDGTRVRDVVFMVLPDRALTGTGLDGLVGFPVIAHLGAMMFRDSSVSFGAPASGGTKAPLELSGNDPLLAVTHGGRRFLCRLDTGADRSTFSATFIRPDELDGRRGSVRVGTASGIRALQTYVTPRLSLAIGAREFVLTRPTVLNQPMAREPDDRLACNIGRDLLRQAPFYVIDIERLTLVLGGP